MKRYILSLIVLAIITSPASADLFTFDEPSAPETSNDTAISNYMSGIYSGGTIIANDVQIIDNGSTGTDWNGKTSEDDFLRVDSSGDGEIHFVNNPITNVSADGYVFDATEGDDFVMIGYDASFGDYENPNPSAEVARWHVDFGTNTITHEEWGWVWVGYPNWFEYQLKSTWTEVIDLGDNSAFSFNLSFSTPVSLLVFSDNGVRDVGIDNLDVSLVPVPGAALLGLLGLSAAGIKLRKHA